MKHTIQSRRMPLSYERYLDKVHGGWIGKCLGGAAGAPVEGFKKVIEKEHYRSVMRTDLPNDDLDLQLLWLEVLQKKGLDINALDLADAWDRQCWYPFSEYGIFLKNYERGVMPPYSGAFNNPLFKEGEGCPIRSEIWGMVFAGYPEEAARYAKMDGSLDHAGASVDIECYYAAMEAAAFFESDPEHLIRSYLFYLPPGTPARGCAELVLKEYVRNPSDWLLARTRMLRRYAHNEFTNSIPNLGLTLIALLYGGGDLDKTVNIAFRCGYDADCTCATAGAIVGILLGAKKIPSPLKELTGENFVAGILLDRKDFTIEGLAKETALLGVMADKRWGGNMTDIPESIRIPEDKRKETAPSIRIEYLDIPSVNPERPCRIRVVIHNSGNEVLKGSLVIHRIPEELELNKNHIGLQLMPGEVHEEEIRISVREDYDRLFDKNVMEAEFAGISRAFGVCGAAVWEAVGPFLEPLTGTEGNEGDGIGEEAPGEEEEVETGPQLPTMECMVNNAAYLDKEYIDEKDLEKAFSREDPQPVYQAEDMLPMDETFTFHGQGCIYLRQKLLSPETRRVWVIIGNNDGYVLWVNGREVMRKDTIRLWTPYNNYFSVELKAGVNEIGLKLLRRTESLRFSIAFRRHEGDFFHRKRWLTDMASVRLN